MVDLGDFEPGSGESASGQAGSNRSTAEDAAPSTSEETDAEATSADRTPSSPAESDDSTGDVAFERYDAAPAGQDRGIGAIAVSQGLRVAEDGDDTSLRAYVTTGNRDTVRLGKYLLVPYPDDELLFSRITALEYAQEFQTDDATEIHARRAMRRDEFEERDYKFVASLDPLAVLFEDESGGESESGESDGDLKRRMVDRVPKPGAVVAEATDPDQIKTGLKIPGDGIFLGHLSVGGEKVRTAAQPPTIDYRLRDDYDHGDPLVFRHTLVAGGTGSGKTHATKNVLRQLLAEDRTYEMDDGRSARLAVVQFDPQDEYAQMHDDNPAMDDATARRYEREGIVHGGHDDTLALVPKEDGVPYGGDNHRAEQLEFTIPFSMARDRPWLVAGSSLNENQYPALKHLLERFFREYGNSGTYAEFLTFLDDPALREQLDESGRVHESTFDAVKRRVHGVPNGVFDQSARPITELDHQLVRPGGLTVIPTYHLSTSRAKELFVLAVSSMLIDDKLSNAPDSTRIKETPLLLGMDEAHNFLADADTVQARKVISKFTEAAKQGRKERLGLFLVTQDPQDVAESVFKQINTRLVLNLGDEDAIKSVNIPPELEDKVPYMEKGQAVVYSPDNSEPVELVGLPVCLTRHGE
ncbi:ATP-binding protein [Halobellus sp. Atlit-38R]|uniref:ATP-binding protein n=1 Tax=Halobellus sp. Atlit-38R TaxID=2282131 RepID=UPI000EF1D8FF|nr:ATP-binding protein [Halobellus sp. Atlit-38R]RLM89600.1 ATP-binding protein [Halobellus sp. Atlit-38R]